MKGKRLYGIADIHLFPEAERGIRLPLHFSIVTPVQFHTRLEEWWSLWIVPEEPLDTCRWGRAKVAIGMQEYASQLMVAGTRFDIWFGGHLGGEGIIREVYECDNTFYDRTFRFSSE